MIEVHCHHCGLTMLVPATLQGREGMCFSCGAKIFAASARAGAGALPTLTSGARVNSRYAVERELGKGGMGRVYLAHDHLTDEPVALKFIDPRLLRSQRARALFTREAQVSRRLRHDAIVFVHDIGATAEGVLFLSMEYLEGQSLRRTLQARRAARKLPSIRFAVQVTAQVLAALDYAHRYVVHRDVKPENVMMLPGERVKVLDFGLALARDEEERAEPGEEGVVGTFAYAAPEQKRRAAVDKRADVFAAGLLLRELLTLHAPSEAKAPAALRRDVSPGVEAALARALADDPEDRWPTAAAFREELETAYRRAYLETPAAAPAPAHGGPLSTEGMVLLEGGSFLMGSNERREEQPELEAEVEPFYMDVAPVTNQEYARFLQAAGREPPPFWDDSDFNGAQQPVAGVTWQEARDYAAWAGKALPSEAQWEFAARGRANRRYPWGRDEPSSLRCNYATHVGIPTLVTMHAEGATPEGVLDLAGNVYEWTRDCFVAYQPGRQGTPVEEGSPQRVVRGGCWRSPPEELRCSFRKGLFPETRLPTVGFRCVAPAGGTRPAR